MEVTIVAPDNLVLIEGKPHQVDCSALTGVHAVQWDGTKGWIEFMMEGSSKQPNEPIYDISPYQSYIDAWTAAENYIPPPPPPPTPADLIAYANAAQWKRACGGYTTTVNGQQYTFATTPDSMALITGKYTRLTQPNAPSSVSWQIDATTFITISAQDFGNLATNIADFVQSTFDALPGVISSITAGITTTTAQIDQVFSSL